MKQIGEIGRQNLKANKVIDKMLADKDIRSCEIGLPGCTGSFNLQRCHRKKRHWFRGQMHLLSDWRYVCYACGSCHAKLEVDAKLTEEVFMRLRGGRMKIYTIQPDRDLNKYTERSLEAAIDGLEIELEEASPGTVITIEIGEMSEEDYEKFPEYDGP